MIVFACKDIRGFVGELGLLLSSTYGLINATDQYHRTAANSLILGAKEFA